MLNRNDLQIGRIYKNPHGRYIVVNRIINATVMLETITQIIYNYIDIPDVNNSFWIDRALIEWELVQESIW